MIKTLLTALLVTLIGAGTALAAEPVSAKGLVIQGNQLKAMPGYVLEKGPNKQVLARPARGGLGFTADCSCRGGTGGCDGSITGDVAICSRSSSSPCSGTCSWAFTPGVKLSK